MAENKFTVYSTKTLSQFIGLLPALFDREKYIVFSWKIGPKSSMPQKALIHIWFKIWVAFIYKKPVDLVTANEIDAMKRSVKVRYYNETAASFMVEELRDPLAPDKRRLEFTSIATWGQGECFAVMEWMQDKAAEQGLILEADGEYKTLKTSTTR